MAKVINLAKTDKPVLYVTGVMQQEELTVIASTVTDIKKQISENKDCFAETVWIYRITKDGVIRPWDRIRKNSSGKYISA